MASADERPVIVRVKRKASQCRFDAIWLEINERRLKSTLLELEKLSISEIAAGGGSPNNDERPVTVGVKRTASQARLDALFAELVINERPLKRTSLDFGKLSTAEFSASIVEEFKTRKVLLCHVKTVANSEVTSDVLQSVVPASADASTFESKSKEMRRTFKARRYKHDQLPATAKQSQELESKNAQFMQIWGSRKSKNKAMHDESLHNKCQFYDVVRVDFVETKQEIPNDHKKGSELDDHELMSLYLPLLKEFIPSAAIEIESDYISSHAPSDGFVYDIYVVNNKKNISELDVAETLPLVQVDAEDDYNDWPDGSEHESDDSNAENNPLNEYPDEEPSKENNEDGNFSEARSKTDWTKTDWRCFDDDDQYRGVEEEEDDDEIEDWE